jgi:spermidine synthase
VAQIVLLRELMALFYGIELGLGAVLTVWLLGSATGCTLSAKLIGRQQSMRIIFHLTLAAALLLPAALFLVRAAGPLWGIAAGDIPPLDRILAICIITTFPCSFISGALFSLCWFFSEKAGAGPMRIYSGEALGATAGGVCFYLLVMSRLPALAILLFMSLVLVAAAAGVFMGNPAAGGRRKVLLPTGIFAAALATALVCQNPIDHFSRRLQWGPDFLAARDTPYQNLAILSRSGQSSVFANGLWQFSVPDRQSLEYAVHPALLQHPSPKSILVLGGLAAGLPEEVLRHPSVEHVTAVALDPAVVEFSEAQIFKGRPQLETLSEVTTHYQDAALFLRNNRARYDVILMNVGDPVNAQLNRFYTTSFFSAVKDRLAPEGIFSFDVSGGEEMLGEVQIDFLGTIFRTLERSFQAISILPGDRVRFFAADGGTPLANDYRVLSERIRDRDLDLSYVRPDTLQDRFEPFRMQYYKDVLKDTPAGLVNRDFTPLCYTHAIRLWARQWHPVPGAAVRWLTRLSPTGLWVFFLVACLLVPLGFRAAGVKPHRAVCLNVAVVGGACMVIQMVLLIVFQILEGALFLHLALMVALFMAGLAAGAAFMSRAPRRIRKGSPALKRLIHVQALFSMLPFVLAGLFLLLHGPSRVAGGGLAIWLFSGLSFVSGTLEGMHFAVAAAAMAELGQPATRIGGRLYAFDLLGSAGGLLAATFLLVPVFGPVRILPLLGVAACAGLVLLTGPEGPKR